MEKNSVNKNYERILNKSTQLFNRHGVVKVSVQRIADTLRLSPGNVHYHFNKKNDIISGIFSRLEAEFLSLLNQVKSFRDQADIKEHYDFLIAISELLWKYRCIFNNILFLNSEDPDFGRRFRQLQKKTLTSLADVAKTSVKKGWTKPFHAPNNAQMLSENLWNIWMNSIRLSQLEATGVRKQKKQMIHYMLIHQLALMERHYKRQVSDSLFQYMEDNIDNI